jgi:hypothetical protein
MDLPRALFNKKLAFLGLILCGALYFDFRLATGHMLHIGREIKAKVWIAKGSKIAQQQLAGSWCTKADDPTLEHSSDEVVGRYATSAIDAGNSIKVQQVSSDPIVVVPDPQIFPEAEDGILSIPVTNRSGIKPGMLVAFLCPILDSSKNTRSLFWPKGARVRSVVPVSDNSGLIMVEANIRDVKSAMPVLADTGFDKKWMPILMPSVSDLAVHKWLLTRSRK